jgi:predicted peroxiredoxin
MKPAAAATTANAATTSTPLIIPSMPEVYAGRRAHPGGGTRDMPPAGPGGRDRQRPSAATAGRAPAVPDSRARVRARVYSASMAAHTLVIKVTAGKDEPERCGQALTVAATAIASGVAVSLWLAAEAAWLALPGRAADIVLPHSPPMADLLASIVAGGRVTLCTQCAARRDIGPGDVIEGIQIGGAATFVSEVTADGTQALVY